MPNYELLHRISLDWIKDMLLHDEIRLKDIPADIRISDTCVYVTAFRISNKIACKRFIGDLRVLCRDILTTNVKSCNRKNLLRALSTYLAINDYLGDENFEDFKNDIPPHILQEVQGNNETVRNNIESELKKQGIIES
jgi:hypothetical protein